MRRELGFLGVVALMVAALWYSLSPQFPVAQGLDLQGGMRVTLKPDYQKLAGKKIDLETMTLVRRVIENRVNSFGLSGTEVRLKGEDQILILLPGAKRPEEALKVLVTVAQLEFRYLSEVESNRNPSARYKMTQIPGDPEKGLTEEYRFVDTQTDKPVPVEQVLQESELILKGDWLQPTSEAALDPNRAQPYVSFQFNAQGAKAFGDFTTEHVDEILAIVLDGKIISAPNITEPITGGEGQISGGFQSMVEARLLANLLNSGALPIPLESAEVQTVGATLGQESIDRSIQAGLAGLGIVLLFMLGYYWLPGFVACLALIAYAAITFAIFKGVGLYPPIVLDLPGITGFILSIGMAVDGNVLIFERMKEELRAGKSHAAAVDAGFQRAFSAIVDSNVTVWIICAVLIWLGTPMVKGFAITLAIGNAVAMFTAITVTRLVLQMLTRWEWARNPALYAIHNSWLNLFFPAWRQGGVMRIWDKRRIYFGFSILLAAASLVFVALTPLGMGLKPGIDFTGGSAIEVAFRNAGVTRSQVVDVLKGAGVEDATVRIGYSDQPWTRVTVSADEVDAPTATQVRDRLAQGVGLPGFDPDAYVAGDPGKAFTATAVYTGPVTEAQARAALVRTAAAEDRPLTLPGLKVTIAPVPHQGEARITVAEVATKQLPPTRLLEVKEALGKIGGGTIGPMSRVTSIGPSIAAEVTRNGILSTILASVAMLLFLAVRFAIGGFGNGLKFGLGAVIALFHDVLITIGLFAVMGVVVGWQVDSLFLTACLGLLGFSVNDTIVIYDRIRENLARRKKGETFPELTDRSMTESFDRSVNTSFAIILALLAMVIFGGETLRLFNFALLFGMAIGTYSSVFVASPLVVLLARTGNDPAGATAARAPAEPAGTAPAVRTPASRTPEPRPTPARPATPPAPAAPTATLSGTRLTLRAPAATAPEADGNETGADAETSADEPTAESPGAPHPNRERGPASIRPHRGRRQ